MTVRNSTWWWLGIAAAFCGFVWLFKGILLPFVAGVAIAYFLDPLTDRLERIGIGRAVAAMLTLLGFFVAAVAVTLLLLPLVTTQIGELVERLPGIVDALQKWALSLLALLQDVLSPEDFEKVREALAGQFGTGVKALSDLLQGVLTGGFALLEFLSVLLVTPVVAFYLLRDWDRLVAQLYSLVPPEHRETARTQAALVDETLAGFVRGQGSVCLILGFGYGGALALAGLPFGFIVGLTAGLISFIPYLGSIVGLVLSVGLALLEFSDLWRVAIIAAIFLVGQFIEGNYLTPKLVGERVRLHPVWVIFALFAGGTLLGFLGMLIAVPVAAVIGVLVRFLVEQYRASRLFESGPP